MPYVDPQTVCLWELRSDVIFVISLESLVTVAIPLSFLTGINTF